jgi:hypothetical protein
VLRGDGVYRVTVQHAVVVQHAVTVQHAATEQHTMMVQHTVTVQHTVVVQLKQCATFLSAAQKLSCGVYIQYSWQGTLAIHDCVWWGWCRCTFLIALPVWFPHREILCVSSGQGM